MKTPPSSFVIAAVSLGLPLCSAETRALEERAPFEAGSLFLSSPPMTMELEANNMNTTPGGQTSTPSAHTPPTPVHVPTPPSTHNSSPPGANNVNQRIMESQAAAVQAANRQLLWQGAAISAYAATQLQRQIAVAHGRAFMAALRREEAEASIDRGSGGVERRLASAKKQPHHKRHRRRKHHARYIAVDTAKDRRASRGAKRIVMIWDTYSESLVGNNVYEVKTSPSLGQTLVFDTYSTEYVGDGTLVPDDGQPAPAPVLR